MSDAMAAVERTVAVLPEQLRLFSDAQASQAPAPGRWTKKQVVGHLVDSASNNHQRFVRAALAGSVEFPGYEQNPWVDLQQYQQVPWEELIVLWTALNCHLLHIFRQLTPEQWSARCSGGDRGDCTLSELLDRFVSHLHQHLVKMLGAWPPAPAESPADLLVENGIRYRLATADDLEALQGLWWEMQEGHVAYEPRYYDHVGREKSCGFWVRHGRETIANPDNRIYVALDGEIPVGLLMGHLVTRPPVYATRKSLGIGVVAVTAAYRRRGIGKTLLRLAETWGRETGAAVAELSVSTVNPAVEAYSRAGYRGEMLKMIRWIVP